MIRAQSIQREFQYRRPATTSRGTYLSKTVWFIILNDAKGDRHGIGECSLFPGLSQDDVPGFGERLQEVINQINHEGTVPSEGLEDWPSLRFALETARRDLESGGSRMHFPSAFTNGEDHILINGLIWMGGRHEMITQIREKLDEGFTCLKMKVGAIGIEQELAILDSVRKEFSEGTLELRVDANGAFRPDEAMPVLERLATLRVHSIEQPLRKGQAESMAWLCRESPLPIALDEELIGIHEAGSRRNLLEAIRPHYIILKPGLLGGIQAAGEWRDLARELGIGYWITSSLETNVGLNAIAQWTYTLDPILPQGLSTGSLFADNIPSPLMTHGERLVYSTDLKWDLGKLLG